MAKGRQAERGAGEGHQSAGVVALAASVSVARGGSSGRAWLALDVDVGPVLAGVDPLDVLGQVGAAGPRRRRSSISSRPILACSIATWRSIRAMPSSDQGAPLVRVVRLAEAGPVVRSGGLVLEELADLGQAEPGVVAEALDEPQAVEVVGVVEAVGALATGRPGSSRPISS